MNTVVRLIIVNVFMWHFKFPKVEIIHIKHDVVAMVTIHQVKSHYVYDVLYALEREGERER